MMKRLLPLDPVLAGVSFGDPALCNAI